MIALQFPSPVSDLIAWMPGQFAALGQSGVVVKRITREARPRKLVLLRDDGGPRVAEVHRIHRIGAQVWATFENGQTDWDTLNELAAQTAYLFEKAVGVIPRLATITDSSGPAAVLEGDVEYRYLTAALQMRGVRA